MIATVRGTVEAVGLESAVIEVSGVGMLVRAAPATLAELRVGAEARLATSLVVREDSLTLYGFTEDDEREVFETLQTVSGVGPRLALAILAVHGPDELRAAVSAQDIAALTRVPGIGKKGAQRILLEIGDKLGPVRSALPSPATTVTGARPEVVDALAQLGWPVKAAEEAVAAVLEDTDGDVATVLRAALQHLGGRSRV